MGAISGIYLRIDGHSMNKSEWLLNCASILGKAASALLIVPTSEALGQLKWNWFHKSNAMWDFEIFDKASRGPWGAALLLYRTKGQSLAALGALLIVLLLAIDTFFQQVIQFPDTWTLAPTPSLIPRVIQYAPFYTPEYIHGLETTFINPAFRPVVGQFFIDNGTQPVPFGNGTRPEIPLSCPTSNCTWPEYETLGVCSQCVEISDMLDYACLFTRIDWSTDQTGELSNAGYPNATVCGYFLNVTSSAPVLMSGYIVEENSTKSSRGEVLLVRTLPLIEMITKAPIYRGSVNFKHIVNPILDAFIVSAANGADSLFRKETPVAHECVLAWCVQTIISTYSSGVYSENITSTFLNTSTEIPPFPWESFPVKDNGELIGNFISYTQEVIIQPPPPHESSRVITSSVPYRVDNTTASNILQSFDDYFPSYYTAKTHTENPMLRYKDYIAGPSLRKLAFNPLLAPNNITRHMERLAFAMTNIIRSDTGSDAKLSGFSYNKTQSVSVRWEWLIFPFALLFLSLTFLISTIIKTSKDTATGVWKTSAMPTLIYGLPEEARGRFAGSKTWNSSQGETKKVRVKLLPDQGWRISGQNLLKPPLLAARKNQPPPGWI
jgi:hypothetical protein